MTTYDELPYNVRKIVPVPVSGKRLEKVLRQVSESQNSSKKRIYKEIACGDLYHDDGALRGYWHTLATREPKDLTGRRGQWVAGGDGGWGWQDWGADYGFEAVIVNKRAGSCDGCGKHVHGGSGAACLKERRWWLACRDCQRKYEITGPRISC